MYILTKVSDILHAVFCSYKEKVLPWFEQLLQLIVNLIVSNSLSLSLIISTLSLPVTIRMIFVRFCIRVKYSCFKDCFSRAPEWSNKRFLPVLDKS